jgi:hypothetical protein
MYSMKNLAAGVLLACLLSACETTSRLGSVGSLAGKEDHGLELVAGTWRFSHFGAPTVRNERVPNPGKELRKHLIGTTIAIENTGAASSIAPGHAASFQFSVIEETPLYLKIGAQGLPIEEAYVYDKTKRLIMMPSKLTIEGERGVLPTYFKRIR